MQRLKDMFGCLIVLAAGYALLLAGGCAQHSKPPAPPLIPENATIVKTSQFLGTPMSGALLRPPPANVNPDDALAIEVSFVALERMPSGIGSLDSKARLIIATHGASPVRSTGMLTRLAGYATGEEAENFARSIATAGIGRSAVVGHAAAALPDGATARFEIADSEKNASPLPAGIGHRRFQVQLCRPNSHFFTPLSPATLPTTQPVSNVAAATEPASSDEPATAPPGLPTSRAIATSEPQVTGSTDSDTQPTTGPSTQSALRSATGPDTQSSGILLETAVELDDYIATEAPTGDLTDAPATANAPQTRTLRLETLLLDPRTLDADSLLRGGATAVVAVPFKFRDGHNQYVAAIIRIKKGSKANPAHRLACAESEKQMLAAYIAAQLDATSRTPPNSEDAATVYGALADIVNPRTRRSAAAYLAAWSGARFCEDVVLSCDETIMAQLGNELAINVGSVTPEKPSIGWKMERIALDYLAELQNDGRLPPELEAILSDRAGEVGRHASAMEEVLRDLHGPEDFNRRLLATNRLYLEDSSPGSRARAYDWLRNRGQEPAGYQPLAPSHARRAALEKYYQDITAAAQSAATQPGVVR